MKEIFKKIPGYESYFVSNLGNVVSNKFNKNKILKQSKTIYGHLTVTFCYKGKTKTFCVHQVVAMAFLNHVPCGLNLVVDHINDIKTDNRIENLQIITHLENINKNKKKPKYKGVYWNSDKNMFISRIKINNKLIHLGLFNDELKAYQTYLIAESIKNKYENNNEKFRDLCKERI